MRDAVDNEDSDTLEDLRRAQEAETRLTRLCARLTTDKRRLRCCCYALALATAVLAVVCCVVVMG